MTRNAGRLLFLLVAVAACICPTWSDAEEETRDRFGLTPAEGWLVNHYLEVVSLCLPIEDGQPMWSQVRVPEWTIAVSPTAGVNPTTIRLTKGGDGRFVAQRKRSTGASLWDAAVSARRSDSKATTQDIAQRIAFALSHYDQATCPSLTELGTKLEALRFGPITKGVTESGGQVYRYRADYGAGHWIEGQLVGTGRVDPNLNPPVVDWFEALSSALDHCDRQREEAKHVD